MSNYSIYITEEGLLYSIKSPFDVDLIDIIKSVPGRQWNQDCKKWYIPKDKLGWLIRGLDDSQFKDKYVVLTTENLNVNSEIPANNIIPDIDISDVDQYVMNGGKLYSHQIDFLKYSKNKEKNGFILADEMGCISGDAKIYVKYNNNTQKIPLDTLYNFYRFHLKLKIQILALNTDTNMIEFHTLNKVIFSGSRIVYELILDNGISICATADHEIYTDKGFKELQDLTQDDCIGTKSNDGLLSFHKISNVKQKSLETTYDIKMNSEYHNFIANDVVVHNCGKTLEVTNLAKYQQKRYEYKHCLILCCVNSAKYSWQEDIEKHTNKSEEAYILGTRINKNGVVKYSGSSNDKLEDLLTGCKYGIKDGEPLPYFIILNIEALRYKDKSKHYAITEAIVDMIQDDELQMIAIDEVHKNVSPKSMQGKLLLTIKKNDENKVQWIPMTGTPIVNRPTDLFTPLKLVNGHDIKSYYNWCQCFCVFGGYDFKQVISYKNIPQLKEMLKDHMLRRLKTDVLDLPEKIYFTEYVENTKFQTKLYSVVQRELVSDKLKILAASNPLSMMLRLRQVNGSPELITDMNVRDKSYLSCNAKLSRLIEIVKDIVSQNEKFVIFSNWVEPLRTIYRYLLPICKIASYTGTMTEEARQQNKHLFINDPEYKGMIGTIGALGTNHTLTVATHVIFYDEPWTPADRNQAIDRLHRVGQKNNITIHTLIVKDTIDDVVHEILEDKYTVSNFIVDDKINLKRNPELFDMLLGIKSNSNK